MKVTPKMGWAVRGALMGRRKGWEKRRWLEVKVSHRTKLLMDQRAPLDGILGQVLHKTVSEIEIHVQEEFMCSRTGQREKLNNNAVAAEAPAKPVGCSAVEMGIQGCPDGGKEAKLLCPYSNQS